MTGQDAPRVVDVRDLQDVRNALAQLDLAGEHPVLVNVGGAGGLDGPLLATVNELFRDCVVPVLARHSALVVDGGTASGVMWAMGRAARGSTVPVIGVAAVGTVAIPDRGHVSPNAAPLDADHRAVLLAPGDRWGDESWWIAAVAGEVAGSRQSVTLLVNGGEVAYDDAQCSVEADRPLLVLAGTGRTADEIAGAFRTGEGDPRAVALAGSGLLHVVDLTDWAQITALLDKLLAGPAASA